MKLEQQVCSFELAKRLKELGVKQESFFVWSGHTEPATLWRHDAWAERDIYPLKKGLYYAALTIAELGEMLPMSVGHSDTGEEWLFCTKVGDGYSVGYGEIGDRGIDFMHMEEASTEADARAKMLIYLLENNLITI